MREDGRKRSGYVVWFEDLRRGDVGEVGGKNASLGEMIGALAGAGIPIPPGFATRAAAYRKLVSANELGPRLAEDLAELREGDSGAVERVGARIRERFLRAEIPEDVEAAIREAYQELCAREGVSDLPVAVRSSATAEDLPEASFAGQQESFLNVRGADALIEACRRCFASLFTDRAISYRERLDFDHLQVALSVGVQRMVEADRAGAGVLFTLDPDTGFPGVVLINAAWGLGESVVKGAVDPDQYLVFKPFLEERMGRPLIEVVLGSKKKKIVYGDEGGTRTVETTLDEREGRVLDDEEIERLARWGVAIEDHYDCPMDIEWAKDARTGELFVVQARPETVWSRVAPVVEAFTLEERVEPLVSGVAVGSAVATGPVRRVSGPEDLTDFPGGAILVAERTDPDWGPVLAKAQAVVTDQGGRTSHAAIVSRELGIPAVVGTGNATRILDNGSDVTVSCAEGDTGYVYPGVLPFERREIRIDDLPPTRLPVVLNVGNPAAAFRHWRLPTRGVGLARIEFIIGDRIGVHPMALVHPGRIQDPEVRARVEERVRGFSEPTEYFVHHLATGIARVAAGVYPARAVVRTSDFKTNEYAALLGGEAFEPAEDNPMIGFRGASRYYDDRYREGFLLECRAIRRVRDEMGFTNVVPMIPFCRTLDEADRVLEVMEDGGLVRGENGLEVFVMCEIPSNALLAEEFGERFDGFSIGSNDLTQLTLGVDRDSAELAPLFDERDEAVTRLIELVIEGAHRAGRTVGFCGQAPSDHPAYAAFLVRVGIDSISVNPDSVVEVIHHVAAAETSIAPTAREVGIP